MLVTGFVPDFQTNHLPFAKCGEKSTFHEAGSYDKVQVEESKAHSATPTTARQRREGGLREGKKEKETTVMQVVML